MQHQQRYAAEAISTEVALQPCKCQPARPKTVTNIDNRPAHTNTYICKYFRIDDGHVRFLAQTKAKSKAKLMESIDDAAGKSVSNTRVQRRKVDITPTTKRPLPIAPCYARRSCDVCHCMHAY